VISRSHARDIWDLEPEDGRAVWSLTRAIGDVIRAGLEPHGLTLFQGNETAGWQDGFRFRLHLVPRWLGDGLVKPWQPTDSRRAGIASAAARIRSARPG
jgi:histidine triad (HIT) family protein